MNGIEASDVLRVAVVSGLIGFGVFCASYSLAVWFRRNRSRPNKLTRFSFFALTLGIFGAVGNWAYNEFSQRNGIVGGQDLFVIHAKRNVAVERLVTEGQVKKGDSIAVFLPPSLDEQLAVIDSHIKQAYSKIEYFNLRTLPVDALLLQKQAQIRQQIQQVQMMTLDIQKSRRETERAYLDATTQHAEKRSQNDLQIAAEKQALAASTQQTSIAQTALNRALDLRNRGGIGTVVAVEEKASNHLTQSLALNRAQANLASLADYRRVLDESYGRTLGSLSDQMAKLDGDLTAKQQAAAELAEQVVANEEAVSKDRQRAANETAREREAAMHEHEALRAERASMLAVTQVKAPFSGEVVYRHPAPGFAPENTPVLALSAGSGFIARIWVPTEEIDSIKAAGKVQLALEQPILNKFFQGEFRRFEEAPYEKNRVIAVFDVKLPLEAITLLAGAGNPVQAKLLWRPDLMASYPFRGSLVLAIAGCVGMFGSGLRRRATDEFPLAAQLEEALLEDRLHEAAFRFHALLRQGRLDDDPDLVRTVIRLAERIGEPALSALREEIVFDEEFENALREWSRRSYDPALIALLDQVRNSSVLTAIS
ncbi:HlyD family efflux transporter periplasmic adaptor subunit (plasmid) [Roseomonas marmotae]|uniref:HlyD family efflux transporter periplasmic adaptor subunit n=2 Tax=Roseomonas marmotae TaxID=2768161 RepID=A0ABS3KIN5_9PROT|nr:HlyD family secretion protein [Roseomonas marmotae]MBO1077319.1 HlyD family efflux transporter periplasmic adaptor subunit [Roseomonas marmotae]QTI81093.1 HlyD family efflux transporter periplasmic adaptor subunit [Roseomonas marmotae]